MNKMQFAIFIIISALAILAVMYFAEHNRLILLVGVYPAITFATLALVAWCERTN